MVVAVGPCRISLGMCIKSKLLIAHLLQSWATALWLPGKFLVRGGDSSAVQKKLKTIQEIQASSSAFTAILEDGSVVPCGHPECGGRR